MDSRTNRRRKTNNRNFGRRRGSNNGSQNKNTHKNQIIHELEATNKPSVNSLRLIAVKELLKKDPQDIVFKLCDKSFGYGNYLEAENISDDLIDLFTELISKALQVNSMRVQISRLILPLASSPFLTKHVYEALGKHSVIDKYNIKLIKNVIDIYQVILEMNPACIISLGAIKDRVELIIKNRIKDSQLIEDFEKKVVKSDLKANRKREQIFDNNFTHLEIEPPNDFSEVSITPSMVDIINDQYPVLRKNITNGAYQSVHHYLDVQFRLLREDFLQPLRTGVVHFRDIIKEANHANGNINNKLIAIDKTLLHKLYHINSLQIYFHISVQEIVTTDYGIVFAMKLDSTNKSSKNSKINWDESKRLMFGSLVCLSDDHFLNNCIIGTICQRDTKKLKEGVVFIKFDFNNRNGLPKFGESYTMLETTAYFESYKHVLEALVSYNRDNENEFPFKDHIVYAQNQEIAKPRYLENAYIDFRPVVDKNKTLSIDKTTGLVTYSFKNDSNYAKQCFINDPSTWPTPDQLEFDKSQYNAMKLVLTNKLALIQGPPGTGKTFIGVKIVQLLLHNKHLWYHNNNSQSPILMVCYTNHALDQFLELCIKICSLNRGVVRVGGRCKTTSLEPFLLKTIKQTFRKEKRFDINLIHAMKTERTKLTELGDHIESRKNCEKGILRLSYLLEFMNPNEEAILSNDFRLLAWLGFFKKNIEKYEYEEIGEEIEKDFDSSNIPPNIVDSDLIDEIVNENEEAERMLESDYAISEAINSRNSNKNKHSAAHSNTSSSSFVIDTKEILQMYEKILSTDTDSWQVARKKTSKSKQIDYHLKKILGSGTQLHPNTMNIPIHSMRLGDRYKLYNRWLAQFKRAYEVKIDSLQEQYNQSANALYELRMQYDAAIMKQSLIIAMTTTGAARYHNVLKDIGPRIVIVEEAAEVFEAHIVSALSKDCQHLVLIGDHAQLRPNPTVYKLARDYNLDVSLFERLIKNNLKREMLICQHRMRPQISYLMGNFYKDITDHKSVLDFPSIIGLKDNIFFIDHNIREKVNNSGDDNSKSNPHEAEFLAKFCNYIVKQKQFDESKITILSMYLGQLKLIRSELRKVHMSNVKVSTVDNFQGEENEIILLSLVRSNDKEIIGFLKTENRICVALSRARCGLFVIGNLTILNRQNEKWAAILQEAKLKGSLGEKLTLTCGNHPQNDILANIAEDFDKRPEGGCSQHCDYRLECGHVCKLYCHIYDPKHKEYASCKEICNKIISTCGHVCKLYCHLDDPEHKEYASCKEKCNKIIPTCGHICKQQCSHNGQCFKCNEQVEKHIAECGHKINISCDETPNQLHCTENCTRKLVCGHMCLKKCRQVPCGECRSMTKIEAACIHAGSVDIKCTDYEKKNMWVIQTLCKQLCAQVLDCSHLCSKKCGECFGGYIHGNCKEKCNRLLVCGHKCTVLCAKQCMPCQKKCQNRCVHSKCEQICCEPCVPCMEKCTWVCEHQKCTKLCNEICDREICTEPCKKLLKCKHPCIGLCGETCPKLCRICNKEKVIEILFGLEEEEDARFVLLEDCDHIVELTMMQNSLKSKYEIEEQDDSFQEASVGLPVCPKCTTPIRFNPPFSKYVKQQLNNIENVKSKSNRSEATINAYKNHLIKYFKSSKTPSNSINKQIIFKLKKRTNFYFMNDLISFRNYFNMNEKLIKIKNKTKKEITNMYQKDFLEFEINKISNMLGKLDKRFSAQKMKELNHEIDRIEAILLLCNFKNLFKLIVHQSAFIRSHNLLNATDKIEISNMISDLDSNLFLKINPFNRIENDVKEKFKKLNIILNTQITTEEKQIIVKTIGLSQGHWFKCANGHIYCIGECGGAMQKTKCPECNGKIGGIHTFIGNNSLATVMDGASVSGLL